jgi:hypothetical protein
LVIALCAAWHFTDRSIKMEDLGLRALHRRVAGIDVHRMLHVVTVLIEQPDGAMQRQTREFGGFRRDCRALAAWLAEMAVELVVMESTGIYWKSVHAHLENAGIAAWVVNAHMIKHVPGRKTDMADSEWLAVLARFGLVRASFIPPKDLRELRLVSRYRRKLSAMCASEINRLHKILDDGGIKLGSVVSDIQVLVAVEVFHCCPSFHTALSSRQKQHPPWRRLCRRRRLLASPGLPTNPTRLGEAGG